MARNHARVYASIWADDDFRALEPSAQRMFLFLLSQPDLEHSGIIALRERRWSRSARGLTAADVAADLEHLAAARFVVIDEDTEELLVRSLMRWDGVWKQPNVAKAAATQIRTISSAPLREALCDELDRLGEGDLHRESEALREDLVSYLRKSSGPPSGSPSPTPSGSPSRGGQGKGKGNTEVGAKAGSPTPAPAAIPDPPPHPHPAVAAQAPPSKRGTRIPDDFAENITPEMVAWAKQRCPHVDGRLETEKFVNYWQAKGGRDACKLDWVKTWKNRMLDVEQQASRGRPSSNGRGPDRGPPRRMEGQPRMSDIEDIGPHDIAAEQAVLGSMMLSAAAAAGVPVGADRR